MLGRYWKILIPVVAVVLVLAVSNKNESETFGSHTDLSVENQTCVDGNVTIILQNTGTEYINTEDLVVEKDGVKMNYVWDRIDLFPMEKIAFHDGCSTSCDYVFGVLIERVLVTSLYLEGFCH